VVIKTLLYIGDSMENNQLYLIQLSRRTKQAIEELKSLYNRLRNEDIEIAEFQQILRQLDRIPQLMEHKIRDKQNEEKSRTVHSR